MYDSSWQSLQDYIQSASLRTRPSVTRMEKMDVLSTTTDLCRTCNPIVNRNPKTKSIGTGPAGVEKKKIAVL
jgi:hypothetical protein